MRITVTENTDYYQHWWGLEKVTEGIVQQVEEGSRIQVSIADNLTRKERLPGP